jgi:hypothetical protein
MKVTTTAFRLASRFSASSRTTGAGTLRPTLTLLTLALLLGIAVPALGQDDDPANRLWLAFQHHHKVGEKARVAGKLGYKELLSPDQLFGESNKFYLNGDGSYDLGEKLRVDVGLGLYYTYQPEDDDVFETRLWQGGTVFWPDSPGLVRRLVFAQRVRLEERFTDSGGWDFALRFRYRLDTKIAINKYTLEPGAFYLPLAAEFFADLTGEATEFFAEQSRLSIGLGYVLNKNWTLDLRFLRQRSRSTSDEDFTISSNVIDVHGQELVRNPGSGQGEVRVPSDPSGSQ